MSSVNIAVGIMTALWTVDGCREGKYQRFAAGFLN